MQVRVGEAAYQQVVQVHNELPVLGGGWRQACGSDLFVCQLDRHAQVGWAQILRRAGNTR